METERFGTVGNDMSDLSVREKGWNCVRCVDESLKVGSCLVTKAKRRVSTRTRRARDKEQTGRRKLYQSQR